MLPLIILLFVVNTSSLISQDKNENKYLFVEVDNWGDYYNNLNLNGTFILSKIDSDTFYVYNYSRSLTQYLPASTFKILNSLISLETGNIKENEIIKWDGVKRSYDKWNQDQNLKSAIKYSCVWFYQELARRVGKEKMQYYIDATNYGNGKMGADIDNFWLEGNLKISAIEQVEFIKSFLKREFPFSGKNYEIVKNILLIDSTNAYRLYAKTGWGTSSQNDIGWFVGFTENDSGTWAFALNIDMNDILQAKYREEISRKILRSEGIIK